MKKRRFSRRDRKVRKVRQGKRQVLLKKLGETWRAWREKVLKKFSHEGAKEGKKKIFSQ